MIIYFEDSKVFGEKLVLRPKILLNKGEIEDIFNRNEESSNTSTTDEKLEDKGIFKTVNPCEPGFRRIKQVCRKIRRGGKIKVNDELHVFLKKGNQ